MTMGRRFTITIGTDAILAAFGHVVEKARKGPPGQTYTVASGWGVNGVVSAARLPR